MDGKLKNYTDLFVSDLYELSIQKIPTNITHHARRCLLDFIASSFGGSVISRDKLLMLAEDLGDSYGDLPVIGTSIKTNIISAAFLNGIVSHTAELDDGVISGIVHPGSPIFSALIPFAIQNNVNGLDFIKGVVIAYEACVRLSEAIQPSHKLLGYHATSTCGSIGAALGAAVMVGGKELDMKNAFSSAVITSGGTLKALHDDSELKPYNSGNAAMLAISAALLAKAGFSGPNEVLGGDFGFLSMASKNHDIDKLFSNKRNEEYAIEKVYFKPYAACRFCHAPMDATKGILQETPIDYKKIKKIEVETYKLAVDGHDQKEVDNISSAKMSIPFSVSQLLVCGDLGPLGFSEKELMNKDLTKLSKLINVYDYNEFTSAYPFKSQARVKIITDNGTYVKSVDYPTGEPQLPLSDKDIEEKLLILGKEIEIDESKLQSLINASWNLPDTIYDLYKLL